MIGFITLDLANEYDRLVRSAPIPDGYPTVKVPTPAGELEREAPHPAVRGTAADQEKTADYVTVFAVMLRTVRPR